MTQKFTIHSVNPQKRLIAQAVKMLRSGAVVVYPTDSSYALGCQIGDKEALDRIRQIRSLDARHNLTLICKDLSELSTYAKVGNSAFRLMKSLTPGPYTFLLMATRDVPRRLQHPKRKTIGIRVPDHPVTQALLDEMQEPLLTTSLILPGMQQPLNDPDEIEKRLGNRVDLILDCGACGLDHTTVIDLTEDFPKLVRAGIGDTSIIGS